ncbi:MAG: aminotransferase class III-fold pyridoxal phosphate-dependent enzyme [Phycisphaeraceae bacterium]|nr:MAG: aminotransferase class III-fold pyridoxal phosphate-dependent enzyme [Phycisphaeraceae bacterium]
MPRMTDATNTRRLTELDHAHLWHPFTPMRQWREREPCIIERAEGFELIDTQGRRYIDGFSSLWCNVHGHRVPEIDAAIREQLGRVAHSTMLGFASVPAIELGARLVETANMPAESMGPIGPMSPTGPMSEAQDNPSASLRLGPPLTKVFYSDAGATAVEVALKMAAGRHYHRGERERTTFVSLFGAYHGDTFGAISVGFTETFHAPYRGLTFPTVEFPAPDVCRMGGSHGSESRATGGTALRAVSADWPSWDNPRREFTRDYALAALDRTLDEVGDRCAGVIIEPIMQGAAGMIEQPEGFLAGVAERVRSRGLLLIADAVAVGFGRTGTMFACEEEGVRPDILCLAKGITGGYLPLAATLCTDEIAEAFEGEPGEGRTLYHGHTYTGNPLACAAALASLDLFEKRGVLANVRRLSEIMRTRLRDALADHPNVGDVRLRGVMCGIELVQRRDPWTPFNPASLVGAAVCGAARPQGLIIRPLGDVVILMPAPGMDQDTLERMLDAAIGAIRDFDFTGAGGVKHTPGASLQSA